MKNRVTLEAALRATEYAIKPICCWPPPAGSSAARLALHNFFIVVSILNLLFTIGAFMFGIYIHIDDNLEVIKKFTQMGALMSLISKIVICKINAPHLQILIAELVAFLDQASPEQRGVMQDYVNKILTFHEIAYASAIFGTIAFVTEPLITSEPLPGEVDYPFSVEPYWIWTLCYISTSTCVVQVACTVFLDIFYGMLMWFMSARYQMLIVQFERAVTADDIMRCIQQHQMLLIKCERLQLTTRVMAIAETAIAMWVVALGGLVLVKYPSAYDVAKHISLIVVAAAELYLITWPADHLMNVSEEVGDAAFNCDWIGKSSGVRKNILFVVCRSRKPVTITVNGFLPALTLEFFGSSMAASFSYFTALRAMTEE